MFRISGGLLVVIFILGCALLAWSADRFIQGCVVVAKHFHVPQLIVGMVLIGFGTLCPELIVSFFSSIKGTPGIAIGNALGSNVSVRN